MSKVLKINLIIHLFAIAHALTTIGFKYMGWPDDIPLTILTILMIVWVAREYDYPYDVLTAIAFISCLAGFFLGTKGAELLVATQVDWMVLYSNVITTVLVTEILGWTTFFISHKKRTV